MSKWAQPTLSYKQVRDLDFIYTDHSNTAQNLDTMHNTNTVDKLKNAGKIF